MTYITKNYGYGIDSPLSHAASENDMLTIENIIKYNNGKPSVSEVINDKTLIDELIDTDDDSDDDAVELEGGKMISHPDPILDLDIASAIKRAASEGNYGIVKYLIKIYGKDEDSIEKLNLKGALMSAAQCVNPYGLETAKYIIENYGDSKSSRDALKISRMLKVAIKKANIPIIRYVIENCNADFKKYITKDCSNDHNTINEICELLKTITKNPTDESLARDILTPCLSSNNDILIDNICKSGIAEIADQYNMQSIMELLDIARNNPNSLKF